jgi:hypothetical protein
MQDLNPENILYIYYPSTLKYFTAIESCLYTIGLLKEGTLIQFYYDYNK